MEPKPKPLIKASIAVIMLFQVAALFARSFLDVNLVKSGFDMAVAKHLSYLVVPIFVFVLMWPILLLNKDALIGLFRRPDSWPKMILASMAFGLVLRLAALAGTFAAAAFGWLEPGYGADVSFYLACSPPYIIILSILVSSILAPLKEEVINRGLILGSLSTRDPCIAIIVAAVLFTVLHEASGMFNAFVFGLLAGVQLLRYRTLWAPLVAHSTYNLLIVIESNCVSGDWIPEEPVAGFSVVGISATLVGLIALSVAIWIVGYVKAGVD